MSKFIDLTGRTYGRLLVVKRYGRNKHNKIMWLVKCQCLSKPFSLAGSQLRYGVTKSCGCLNQERILERAAIAKKNILPGTVFGKWVVKKEADKHKSGATQWVVECNCGSKKISIVCGSSLRDGHSTSCGCTRRQPHKLYPFGWLGNKVKITYRQGAKDRNLAWELSDDYFYSLLRNNCFYCGSGPTNCVRAAIFPQSKDRYDDFYYSGIDRVNNQIGYTPDNTVSCCKRCNAMKEKLTAQEFIDHVSKITAFQASKATRTTNG